MSKLAVGILSRVQQRVEGVTALEHALLALLVPIVLVVAIHTIAEQES